jgi:phage tail-like protein
VSTGKREDPVVNYNFQITLLDSTSPLAAVTTVAFSTVLRPAIAGFSECTGLEMSLDIQEYMEGGGNHTILKFPTRIKPANLTFKRGLTRTPELWNWFYGFVLGTGKRRDGLIIVQDSEHQPHTVWGFRRGLPVKYSGPLLQAGQSGVAIESIEIAHEGLYQMAGASPLARAVSDVIGLL